MDDKKRRKFLEDMFGSMDVDFEDMFGRMEAMFEEFMKTPSKLEGQPFVYGFSLSRGSDGKPVVRRFGDQNLEKERIREPLSDVIEKENEIDITMEVPGVEKDDMDVEVTENTVHVSAKGGQKYYKEIKLPCSVDSSTTRATYKNGVLSITIKKKETGRKIRVE